MNWDQDKANTFVASFRRDSGPLLLLLPEPGPICCTRTEHTGMYMILPAPQALPSLLLQAIFQAGNKK